jgi:hypothetical protein
MVYSLKPLVVEDGLAMVTAVGDISGGSVTGRRELLRKEELVCLTYTRQYPEHGVNLWGRYTKNFSNLGQPI